MLSKGLSFFAINGTISNLGFKKIKRVKIKMKEARRLQKTLKIKAETVNSENRVSIK